MSSLSVLFTAATLALVFLLCNGPMFGRHIYLLTHTHCNMLHFFYFNSGHPGGYDGRSVPPYPFPQGRKFKKIIR